MAYDPGVDPVLLTAALKAVGKQLGDQKLEPGTYPVDAAVTLRLTGVVKKLDDNEYEARREVPLALLLALLCKRAKLTRADAKEYIRQAAAAAFEHDGGEPEGQADRDRLRDAEEAVEEVRAQFKVHKSRPGATTWNGIMVCEKR